MRKFLPYIFIIIITAGLLSPMTNLQAQKTCTYDPDKTTPNNAPCVNGDGDTITASGTAVKDSPGYHLLQPLPGLTDFNPDAVKDPHALGTYLNIIIKLFIGLCAVLAVVMIVIGGIEYSTSELISGKEAGKERIQGAIFGLLLALCAYTILFQINPNLLNSDVDISGAELNVSIHDFIIKNIIQVGEIPIGNKAKNRGTPCDANVVFQAAQDAKNNISKGEAAALSCIGGKESRGCQAIPADRQTGVSGGGFGQFQIVLSLHGAKFDNSVCKQVAGVDQNTKLTCFNRSTTACQKAASDLRCQAAVTAKIFSDSKARGDYYGDWFRTQGPCANAQCVHELDPSVNLHIKVPAVPGRLFQINDLATYCKL